MNFKKNYRAQSHQALLTLLEWAGKSAELARIAGVTRSTVTNWQSEGRISKDGARAISRFPGCPLTKEQIRPDIHVWGNEK